MAGFSFGSNFSFMYLLAFIFPLTTQILPLSIDVIKNQIITVTGYLTVGVMQSECKYFQIALLVYFMSCHYYKKNKFFQKKTGT